MSDFWKPETMTTRSGEPRSVGYELEFGNLSVRETARALQHRLGGRIVEKNPFVLKIVGSAIGDLKVERDAELLTSVRHRKYLDGMHIDFDPGTLASEIEQGVDRISSRLIPCEIVTSPLDIMDMPEVEQVIDVLKTLRAEGTQASIIYAFGLHINPSVPDIGAETLLNYLQSFLLLSDWLMADSKIDFTRRVFTNYIDPFPPEYVTQVLNPSYDPDQASLIEDYLEFNPSRNRALDMLPVLSEIDALKVLAGVNKDERSLVGKRPALHYRLPDCRVGDENWSVADEWNRWWYVESLAANRQLRNELMDHWQQNAGQFFLVRKKQWLATVKQFLSRHFSQPEPIHG